MKKFEIMKKVGMGVILVAIFLFCLSVYLLIKNGDFLVFFLIIFACVVVMFIGFAISISAKNKEDKLKKELEEQERKRKEEEFRRKQEEHYRIMKENNFGEMPFTKEFIKKYGISFFDFQDLLSKEVGVWLTSFGYCGYSSHYYLKLITLRSKEYMVIYHDGAESGIDGLLAGAHFNESLLETYKKSRVDDFKTSIIPYEYLEYVEYVSQISETTIGKPGPVSLAIHESIFGTASAINKAKNSGATLRSDNSYVKFWFSGKANRSPMIHPLLIGEKEGNFTGLLARIWAEKQLGRATSTTTVEKSSYDKIRDLKELLDEGAISKEEFEAEKKKILNE